MRAKVIRSLEDSVEIEDRWRELAVAQGSAFLSPEWYRCWEEPGGGSAVPLIAVAIDPDGGVAGVLPLVDDRGSRPRVLRFGGSRFGDRFGIAANPGAEAEVARALMPAIEQAVGKLPAVVLSKVDTEAEWPRALQEAAGRRLVAIEQATAEQPHADVSGLDWDGYLAGRSRKFRQRIARGLEKSLGEAGIRHEVRETVDPSTLDADMATLFELHDARRGVGESSIAAEEVRARLARFASSALEQGWLRLRILELDGQPAAAYLGWKVGGRYAVYQSGFDPAWSGQSAGSVLLNDTVRSAIGEHADEVDFLMGGEPYKWRFAPDPRRVRTVTLARPASAARMLTGVEAGARRRLRGLASKPRVGRALKALSRLLPSGR